MTIVFLITFHWWMKWRPARVRTLKLTSNSICICKANVITASTRVTNFSLNSCNYSLSRVTIVSTRATIVSTLATIVSFRVTTASTSVTIVLTSYVLSSQNLYVLHAPSWTARWRYKVLANHITIFLQDCSSFVSYARELKTLVWSTQTFNQLLQLSLLFNSKQQKLPCIGNSLESKSFFRL